MIAGFNRSYNGFPTYRTPAAAVAIRLYRGRLEDLPRSDRALCQWMNDISSISTDAHRPETGITGSIQYALRKARSSVPSRTTGTVHRTAATREFCDAVGRQALADRAVALYRNGSLTLAFTKQVYRYRTRSRGAEAVAARLFVATSKPHVFAERIIDHFGLSSYFEHVFGSELDGTRVNKADLLAYAIETTGVDPSQALMIGDRSHDIVGAKSNGMRGIGVLYGYGSEEGLISAGAGHLCATPRAAQQHIHSTFG